MQLGPRVNMSRTREARPDKLTRTEYRTPKILDLVLRNASQCFTMLRNASQCFAMLRKKGYLLLHHTYTYAGGWLYGKGFIM